MTGTAPPRPWYDQWRGQWRDLGRWALATASVLLVTLIAVRGGAHLGTAGPPFLGRYRVHLSGWTLLAPAVAAAVILASRPRWTGRAPWPLLLLAGWAGAFAWGLSLAVAGPDGIGGPAGAAPGYRSDVDAVGDDPLRYLAGYDADPSRSPAARGHPPGPVLLLWLLHRAGLTGRTGLGIVLAALGALTVVLVAHAVRGVCGRTQARRYLPVLVLAPYAIWLSAGMDVVAALLGATMMLLGIRASEPGRRGLAAAAWAAACGLALGVAVLFAYSMAWLGVSVACLYFARRRPWVNLATAAGALLPVLLADALGFGWLRGLGAAGADFANRVQPNRPLLWWSVISVAVLLLATGPALVASARKVRNTAGWPFLVGAAAAVTFSIGAGLARGGVEYAWLPFFPWLTVAAVAPQRPAGEPVPAPLLLVTAGAVTAVVVRLLLLGGTA